MAEATFRKADTIEKVKSRFTRLDPHKIKVIDSEVIKLEVDDKGFVGSFKTDKGKKRDYKVSFTGIEELLKIASLPVGLKNKTRVDYPELVAYDINYIMKRAGIGNIRAIIRNDTIQSFLMMEHRVIKNEQVIDMIEKKFPEFDVGHGFMSDNGSTMIPIIIPDKHAFKVGKGDKFEGGVTVFNNPLSANSIAVQSFALRLICTNGMTGIDEINRITAVESDRFKPWFRNAIDEATGTIIQTASALEKLKESKLDDPGEYAISLLTDLGIPTRMRLPVVERLATSTDTSETAYDVMNHITYVASHDRELNPFDSLRLMNTAGHMAQHAEQICTTCSRPRRN